MAPERPVSLVPESPARVGERSVRERWREQQLDGARSRKLAFRCGASHPSYCRAGQSQQGARRQHRSRAADTGCQVVGTQDGEERRKGGRRKGGERRCQSEHPHLREDNTPLQLPRIGIGVVRSDVDEGATCTMKAFFPWKKSTCAQGDHTHASSRLSTRALRHLR